MHVYIFVGAPGSGKGTLSALCAKELDWERLSTGELCRKHIAEQTSIGKQIDFAIKSGKLVSDDLMTSMVEQWFFTYEKNNKMTVNKSIILDGYPRTVAQAHALDVLFKQQFPQVRLHIVYFLVSQDTVKERLGGRLICLNPDCQAVYSLHRAELRPSREMQCDVCKGALGSRKDDQIASIFERLKIYFENEKQLLNYYSMQGNSPIELSAEADPLEVFKDFKKRMNVGVA